MPDVKIDDAQLRRLMKKIARVSKQNPRLIKVMLSKIGAIVQGTAVKYAPRSKTKTEYVQTLKGGKTKRKTSSFTSTNLKKSITLELKKDSVEIGVPSNSPAGKYAEKMHDEKGKSWRQLGNQNDGKATDKYIFKAFLDKRKEISKELDHMLDQIIKGIIQ